MRISLRAGERIFLNGAVIRVDRKVSIELLNDVVFLLENPVMQPDQTTTPLRQLYFVIQTILMDPKDNARPKMMLDQMLPRMIDSYSDGLIREGLAKVAEHVLRGRPFEALKVIRGLYPAEAAILGEAAPDATAAA